MTQPAVSQPAPRSSKFKELAVKFLLLTAFTIALGLLQGWAAARTYQPGYGAGFQIGFLHGVLMPAALPGLLTGHELPIYATINAGRPYNIGYILGINACGTFFFGIAFGQRRKKGAG